MAEQVGTGYVEDMNTIRQNLRVGMFDENTLNRPNVKWGSFINLKAKYDSSGAFMMQIASSYDGMNMFVRVLWNETWHDWKAVSLV